MIYGINHEHWKEITDVKHGIQARTAHNIFHKRDSDGKGKKYSAEREYRYAEMAVILLKRPICELDTHKSKQLAFFLASNLLTNMKKLQYEINNR